MLRAFGSTSPLQQLQEAIKAAQIPVLSYDSSVSEQAIEVEVYRKVFAGIVGNECPEPAGAFVAALAIANLTGERNIQRSLNTQPGSFIVHGRMLLPHPRLLRVYWNVTAHGAVALTANLASALDRSGIAFRLKVLLDTSVRRRDAAVLYIPTELWTDAAPSIALTYDQLSGGQMLGQETPLFCKRLKPGLAVAEDPMNGLSFGMHRSRLLARAICSTHSLSQDHITEALRLQFAEEGLSMDKPYLNRGSTDGYEF
jgi:hypothetical protein